MVVMPSSSGPLTAAIIGSVACDVFRAGILPVLVYGKYALENTSDVREAKDVKGGKHEHRNEAR